MAFPTTLDAVVDNSGAFRVKADYINQLQNLLVGPMWFNVKSAKYGAKGDGVTDDTAAIQAAINDAQSVTGGVMTGAGAIVFFPVGTYLCRSGLTISSYITLQGAPQEGSVININMITPGIFITWNNAFNVRFGFGCRDMSFWGQGPADGQNIFWLQNNCHGIRYVNCSFGGALGIQGVWI